MRINAILACVVALCCSPSALASPAKSPRALAKHTETFFRGAPLPKWAKPLATVPTTSLSGPVVLRAAESQMWTGPKPAVLVSRAIQVNDKAHLSEIGQYQLNYSPEYQKLFLHRVAILRAGQAIERTSTVDVRTIEREPSLENGFYDGQATVSLLLQDVRVGDTLLITYSIEGRNPVLGDTWSGEVMWDGSSPTELRRVVVTHPAGRALQWRELGDVAPASLQPMVEHDGAVARLVFEGRALPAVEGEPSVPADYMMARVLQLSEYASWHDVSAWAAGLFAPARQSKDVAEVARQFESLATPEERAGAALHWVQDEIRYFSVALGENSHRPQAPEVVLKRRYGDCKDKSNLLIALLDRLGIKAEPVLVSSAAPPLPQRLLPTPTWFDHVIVRLHAGGKTFFVDPTRESEKGGLSSLPVALGGAAGLVVSNGSDGLMFIPKDGDTTPMVERHEKVVLASLDGDAVLETRIRYRGHYARYVRQQFQSSTAQQQRDELLGSYEKQFKGVALLGDPVGRDQDGGASFEIEARFSLPKPVKHEDGWYSIDHDSKVMEGSLGIPDKLVRKYPFALPLGEYRARYRLQLVWPKEVRLVMLDDAMTVDNEFFRAHKEYAWRNNVVDYAIDYEIKRKQIGANELPELQAQSKRLDHFVQSALKINERSPLDTRVAGLSDRQAAVVRMLSDAAVLAGQTGKSKEPGDFAAFCNALQSVPILTELYPSTAVLADVLLKRTRALAPDEAEMEKCGLVIGFRAQRFEAVLKNQPAAKLKDGDELVLRSAWMNLSLGKAAAAQADATRFLSAQMKAATLTPVDAAQVVAILQRTGQAIPASLQDYAARDAADVWPRPVLAYQLGAITQEQLFGAVEQLPSGARDPALYEAWFHVGQRRLIEGSKDVPLQAFRWLKLHAPRDLMQYQMAVAELNRLETSDPDYVKGAAALDAAQYAVANEFFDKAARRGVAAAHYKLGQAYEDALGVAKNPALAFAHYRTAAELGNLGAMNNLAIMYDEGIGVGKDTNAAVLWFERAAQFGHAHASINIGLRYLENYGGVQYDRVKAVHYLRDAAELGNVKAQSKLGQMYADGQAVDRDYVQAFFWAMQAAERDDTEATAILAFLFAYGHGVPEDVARGIKLFKLAADKGSPSAQTQLGNAYQIGRGVDKNPREALRWFTKAMNENPYARRQVARAYLYGDGTAADFDQAVRILSSDKPGDAAAICEALFGAYDNSQASSGGWQRALGLLRSLAEKGEPVCQADVALSLQFGRGVPVNENDAAVWYAKAASQGIPVALNNLADQYERGAGVAKDLGQAVKLYRQAARKGLGVAFYSLGSLFEEGKGVQADPYLACVYFELARLRGFSDAPTALGRLEKMVPQETVKRAKGVAAAWDSSKPLPDET